MRKHLIFEARPKLCFGRAWLKKSRTDFFSIQLGDKGGGMVE